jgi:hypothetical protein
VPHPRPYTLPPSAAISDKMTVAGISAQTFSRAKPRARPIAKLETSNAAHNGCSFSKVRVRTLLGVLFYGDDYADPY